MSQTSSQLTLIGPSLFTECHLDNDSQGHFIIPAEESVMLMCVRVGVFGSKATEWVQGNVAAWTRVCYASFFFDDTRVSGELLRVTH